MSLLRPRLLAPALALILTACGPAATAVSTTAVPASPTAAAPTAEPPATDTPSAPTAEPLLFHILPEESEARFIIDEVLGGQPNTVIGATHEITGEIRVDPAAPHQAQVGPIHIQVGGLATDNGFRNRAIHSFILQTGSFPEVVFAPTSIDGLPTQAVVGQSFSFTITGDLTIRAITRPVTFTVTVTPESKERVSGTASAQIARADYQLTIPSVRNVANVSETLRLELDFTATS
ncbi:MAG TPA: YceI family protein [Anaerolineales bacterium]|nr:YceI family protein [Anaerolineales bacterium]